MILCLFLLFLLPIEVKAQDTIVQTKEQKKSKINQAATQLKKSLDVNDEVQIAKGYEALAKGFMDKGDVAKSEEYSILCLNTRILDTKRLYIYRN